MVINTISASGLWYTATVLPMPDWVHTRVTRAIYASLWYGKTELVKRRTCQLPLTLGGLAVINPIEKARALKLRWVPHMGDPTYTSKWVCFARFWMGLPLSQVIKGLSFLRSNSVPKYIGDNLPVFFRNLPTAFHGLDTDLTLFPAYKVKTFYAKLAFPSPEDLPCASAWERRLHTPLPWSSLWLRIYGGLSMNWEADIAWRLAHGILKTWAYLKRWRHIQVSDGCSVCGQLETFSHVFL